jgi:DNA-binding transcriptional LysR family regulator
MAQLDQYRIFAAVAKNRSFSKAANELYITQPAVSQSVALLERELEVQLFIRTSRGVILTEAGEILYTYVEQALSAFRGAENHINELKTLEHGILKIGASDTLCQHYLLRPLQSFHEKYPRVNLKVTNRTSQDTVELLKQGSVDIGFINMPTEIGENVTVIPLADLHDCFVYSESHFSALNRSVELRELAAFPLLMLERESSTRRYFDSYIKSRNIALVPQIELGSHDLLLSFAEIGLGIAAAVLEYSQKELERGSLKRVALTEEIPTRQVALIYQSRTPLTFSAKEFINMLGDIKLPEKLDRR